MKKQFFYAAFALAMMASCTSEDTPLVEQPTTPEDDRVAIELGVDTPTITASGRSTGSVGDVAGASNTWNSQRLYIAMFNCDGDTLAKEKVNGAYAPIMDNTTFYYLAPTTAGTTVDWNGNAASGEEGTGAGTGKIRIYKWGTGTSGTTDPTINENDEGLLQYVYYPVNGQYDFIGWHVDDATNTVADLDETKEIKSIKINGSQDIMGAKTKEFTQENYAPAGFTTAQWDALNGWNFSARTARNKIHPILKFEHQLARLKFFVRAGSEQTASMKYDGSAWAEKATKGTTTDAVGATIADPTSTTAMYVTDLRALGMVDLIDLDLNGTEPATTLADALADVNKNVTFTLKGRKDGAKNVSELTPTAPEYFPYNGQNVPEGEDKGTPVGESIMFFPYDATGVAMTSVKLELDLKQYVIDTEDETTDPNTFTYKYKTTTAPVTIHAASVVQGANQYATKFEAGNSYNVYITIYGFERIEVSAELTAWEMGGDVDVDVEEGVSNVKLVFDGITLPTDGPTEAKIKVGNKIFTYTGTGTFEALIPYGTTELDYSITVEGYNPIAGKVTPNASKTISINEQFTAVNQGGQGGAITTTTVTFNITNLPDEGTATIEITEEGKELTTLTYPTQNTYVLNQGATANYTVTATGFEAYSGTIERTETEDEAHTEGFALTAETQAAEPFEVFFDLDGVEGAIITVTSLTENNIATWDAETGKYKITVPAGTTEITYKITANGYNDVTETTAQEVSATNNEINVSLTGATVNPSQPQPDTKEVTVTVQWPEGVTAPTEFVTSVIKVGASQAEEIDGEVYKLEVGEQYTFSASCDGYTCEAQTITITDDTNEVTIVMTAQNS